MIERENTYSTRLWPNCNLSSFPFARITESKNFRATEYVKIVIGLFEFRAIIYMPILTIMLHTEILAFAVIQANGNEAKLQFVRKEVIKNVNSAKQKLEVKWCDSVKLKLG